MNEGKRRAGEGEGKTQESQKRAEREGGERQRGGLKDGERQRGTLGRRIGTASCTRTIDSCVCHMYILNNPEICAIHGFVTKHPRPRKETFWIRGTRGSV